MPHARIVLSSVALSSIRALLARANVPVASHRQPA